MTDTPLSMPITGFNPVTVGIIWYSSTVGCNDKMSESSIAMSSATKPGALGGVIHRNVPADSFDAGTGNVSTMQTRDMSVSSEGHSDSVISPPPSASTRAGIGPRVLIMAS